MPSMSLLDSRALNSSVSAPDGSSTSGSMILLSLRSIAVPVSPSKHATGAPGPTPRESLPADGHPIQLFAIRCRDWASGFLLAAPRAVPGYNGLSISTDACVLHCDLVLLVHPPRRKAEWSTPRAG